MADPASGKDEYASQRVPRRIVLLVGDEHSDVELAVSGPTMIPGWKFRLAAQWEDCVHVGDFAGANAIGEVCAAFVLQVLDAERTMLEAQDRLAAGRTAATTSLVALYRALGGALP